MCHRLACYVFVLILAFLSDNVDLLASVQIYYAYKVTINQPWFMWQSRFHLLTRVVLLCRCSS